ncbi:MAG: sugar phosphate isomerase/epimerase family protein [Phycisphaerales bacterium]
MELGVTGVMLPELDFTGQIALCRELGVKFYQYRPRIIPDDQRDKPFSNWGNHKFDLTPERFRNEGRQLTAQLREAGMEPWGSTPNLTVDMDDEAIRLHIEGAGAADLRCVLCNPPAYPRQPFDYAAFLDHAVSRYAYVIDRISWPMGIKLLIETHAGSLASAPGLAWNLVHHFSPNRIGVIFDLPNFAIEGGVTPHLAVSVLGPYIDCCHVGGARRMDRPERDASGTRLIDRVFCATTESDAHVPTYLKALKAADLNPPLIIEDYEPGLSGTDRLRRGVKYLRQVLGE